MIDIPFYKIVADQNRTYYIRKDLCPVDLSNKSALMSHAELVTELDVESGILFYENIDILPVTLQKIIKSRLGKVGMLVTPFYIQTLLKKIALNETYGDFVLT